MRCEQVDLLNAVNFSGRKTDSVFSRYNTVSAADTRDAAKKIEAGARRNSLAERKETKIEKGRSPKALGINEFLPCARVAEWQTLRT